MHIPAVTPVPSRQIVTTLDAPRAAWRARRMVMEQSSRRYTRQGVKRRGPVPHIVHLAEPLLRAVGLGRRALANTLAVETSEIELFFPHLPLAFDGYTIAHFSDFHIGRVPGLIDRVLEQLRDQTVDLAVITGDFQSRGTPTPAATAAELAPLVAALNPPDGILGVLGNHDMHDVVEVLEDIGIQMLINEHVTISRGGSPIRISGVDDVNRFYTEAAHQTLATSSAGQFSIALVHSAEMADVAAASGYALYLSGHSHGGQVCLPGGRPILTAMDNHRRLATGPWQWDGMLGYTTRGVGVVQRARFNCPPEIVLLRLRCEPYAVLPP
jgi:uncharacterized protein